MLDRAGDGGRWMRWLGSAAIYVEWFMEVCCFGFVTGYGTEVDGKVKWRELKAKICGGMTA
jgi:hypothetical protein